MNLDHHISQLLYRFPCVTVPNFGAFLTETISANIQESTQTFYPPKKVISFNSFLKNNDGLLANHIAATEKISYSDAITAVDVEVRNWKALLENNEFLTLKNIGLLRKNAENNLFFEPSQHTNYLTSSFGFSTYVSPVIKREVTKALNIVPEPELQTPIYNNYQEEEYEERNYLNSFLKYAAIFAISFGGVGFAYSSYIDQQEAIETRIVQAEVQKEVENKIQEATFFIPTSILEDKAAVEAVASFHIIAGSFRSEKNATAELKNLISKGYKAHILDKNDQGLLPIAFESFTTDADAQTKLLEIQQKENKDAWVLIK